MLDPSQLFERRNDLMGLKVYAETMPEAPFAIVDFEDLAAQNQRYVGGIFGDIWHNGLEVALNFTTIVNPSVDGTWNGLVTGLAENRAQIALTALYITYGRSLGIDFSPTIDILKERIFIKNR